MSRIEQIMSVLRERGRVKRMKAHPHVVGCDGRGIIQILKVDRSGMNDPRLPQIDGKITSCTSCGYVQKSGTLAFDDK